MGVLRDRMARKMQLREFSASTRKLYLAAAADGHVSFTYRDRQQGGVIRELTLPAESFIDRMLMRTLHSEAGAEDTPDRHRVVSDICRKTPARLTGVQDRPTIPQ